MTNVKNSSDNNLPKPINIGILLFSFGIGGTEKRFPALVRHLVNNYHDNYTLIINRNLYNKLNTDEYLNDLLKYLYIVPHKDNRFTRWIDSDNRIFKNKYFKIPGINYLFFKVKVLLRRHFVWKIDKNLLNKLDVLHITGPIWKEAIPKKSTIIIESQDRYLSGFKQKLMRKIITKNNPVINFASDLIKNKFLKEYPEFKNIQSMYVNPCSFVDYSETWVDEKQNIISFSGRFVNIKNPFLFLEAIKIISEEYKNIDAHFFLMGHGPLQDLINRFITDNNLTERITVGFYYKPTQILSKSLVFVSLQHEDNYHSQALIEAMACGCAIIATDVGETWKLVSDEVGLRVTYNPEDIADKINYLITNKDKAVKMGINARKKVISEQNIKVYSKYINNLYHSTFN